MVYNYSIATTQGLLHMAASKRFDSEPSGGFIKSQRRQKPKNLKLEEKLGTRFKKDTRTRSSLTDTFA